MLLTRPRTQEFSPDDFDVARDFAAVALKEIEAVRAQVALKQQASFDALTGALNRGNAENLLETAFSEAVLSRQPFSVLFIDLDHFKRINDEYGHPAGDECLIRVTQRILHVLKPGQAIGRYGGEEFIVVLPQIDANRARDVAEKIVETIRSRPITSERLTIPLTVSIGGASRQPGKSSSSGCGSITAPDRICAPTAEAFSMTQTLSSDLSCLSRIAQASPAGPAPTMSTSVVLFSIGVSVFERRLGDGRLVRRVGAPLGRGRIRMSTLVDICQFEGFVNTC